jgi:Ca2+-binding EF-hand superfamily protein
VSAEELHAALARIDTDKDGRIAFSEFIAVFRESRDSTGDDALIKVSCAFSWFSFSYFSFVRIW